MLGTKPSGEARGAIVVMALLVTFACGESRRSSRGVPPLPGAEAGEGASPSDASGGTTSGATARGGASSGPVAGASFGGVPAAAGAGTSAGGSSGGAGTADLGGLGGVTTTPAGNAGLGEGGTPEPPGGGARDPGSLNLPYAPCEPPIGDWCQTIVGVDIGEQFKIALDGAGNVLVAGGAVRDTHLTVDVAVLKLAPDGEVLWGRQLGSDYRDITDGMAVDASGNVFVVGSSSDPETFSPFIAKVSSEGALLWLEKPDVSNHAVGVAADPDGNAVLLVSTGDLFKYAPNGDILWQKPAGHFRGGAAVAVDASGDIFALAYMTDGVGLAKFSSKGEVLWEKVIDEEEAEPYDLTLDPGGDMLLLGVTGMQEYLSRHSATGELLWSQPFDMNDLFTADKVGLDASGNLYVVGMASDFGKPYYDAYLAKYDSAGQVLWGEALGQRGDASRRDLAVSPEGVVYVTGAIDSGAFVTRVTPP